MNFSDIFVKILEMSAVSSVIAIIVICLRKLAGRVIPKGVIFALWSVVILKLLIPVSIPSPVSLYNVVDIDRVPAFESVMTDNEVNISPELPEVTLPSVEAPNGQVTPIIPSVPSTDNSVTSPVLPSVPVTDGAVQSPVIPSTPIEGTTPIQGDTPSSGMVLTEQNNEDVRTDYLGIVCRVYAAIAVALAALIIFAYAFTAYNIGKSETVFDERIDDILGRLPSGKRIRVKLFRGQRSIMIFGILRPTVVLPEDYNSLSDTELTYLLMHEYQHYRHFDTLWNLLMLIACSIHWFNPFVWISRRLFLCDMETACDARVLRGLPENEKSVFAEVLVSFASRSSRDRTIVAMGFGKRNVKERVLSIMKYKKTGIITAIASFVILAVVVSVFATGAFNETSDDVPVADITNDEVTEPEETDSANTEPEESTSESTEAVTEPEVEPEVVPVSVTVTDKNTFRTELSALAEKMKLSEKNEEKAALEFSDIADFKLIVTMTKDGDGASVALSEVQYKGESYEIDFSEVSKKYPNAVLDVVSAGNFVAVGMRNSLGTYYVFTDGGFSLFEMTDDAGYYVWSDSNSLCYMKQNRAFERISEGIHVFSGAYSSPEQFYMDFGKIVSFADGTLNVTKTSWTVQDYFMSDSFVMKAERDRYAYDSVDEFVADYNAGQLGKADSESEEETDEPVNEVPPTEVPEIKYTMKYHISLTEKSNNWFKQVFPNDLGAEYAYVNIGDYDFFRSITAGVDGETMDFYKNGADGRSVPVQYTEWREMYDESFFENNVVLAVYINKSNPTDTFSVSSIGFDSNDKLIISIKTAHREDTPPPVCEQRVYFIELERNTASRAKDIKIKSIGSKYPPTIMNTIWPMDIYIKEDSRYFENNSVNECVGGPSVISVRSYEELQAFWQELNSVADGTYANAADDIMTGIFFKKFNEEYFEKYSVCFVYFPSVQIAEEYLLNDSYYSGGDLHIGLAKREPYISSLRDTKQLLVAVGVLQNVMSYVDGVSIDVNKVIGPQLRGISVMTRLDYLDEEYLWSFASNQSDKGKAGHYPIVAIDSYQKLVGFLDGAHRKIGTDMYVYLTTAYQENYFDEEVLVLTYADEVALNYHAIPVSQYEEYWDGMNSTYKIKYFFEEDDSPYISDYPLSKYAMCHLSLSKREFNDKSFVGFTW